MSLLAGVTLLAVDTETTGFDVEAGARVIEVAAVAIENGVPGREWSSLVNPGRKIPPEASAVHGIFDRDVEGAPAPASVGRLLREACADLPLVLHNAPFDLPFLAALFAEAGVAPLAAPIVDTLGLARGLPDKGGNRLGDLAARMQLPPQNQHRALGDARLTAQVLAARPPAPDAARTAAATRLLTGLAARWEAERGIRTLAELAAVSQDVVRLTARR